MTRAAFLQDNGEYSAAQGGAVCCMGPSLVISICVSGWWLQWVLLARAKVLWSSRSNPSSYSGSSFLLAILRFWRFHLQLETAVTLLELKILLFKASRAISVGQQGTTHSQRKPFTMKDVLDRSLW